MNAPHANGRSKQVVAGLQCGLPSNCSMFKKTSTRHVAQSLLTVLLRSKLAATSHETTAAPLLPAPSPATPSTTPSTPEIPPRSATTTKYTRSPDAPSAHFPAPVSDQTPHAAANPFSSKSAATTGEKCPDTSLAYPRLPSGSPTRTIVRILSTS